MFFPKLLSVREWCSCCLYGAERLIRTFQVGRTTRHQDGNSLPFWPTQERQSPALPQQPGESPFTAPYFATESNPTSSRSAQYGLLEPSLEKISSHF